MTHELKCWPAYFDAVADGIKKVEVRRNDRNYQAGDALVLKEWCPNCERYTGGAIYAEISHIFALSDVPGLARVGKEFVVMSLVNVSGLTPQEAA
jgi:hypothetical protein